MFCIAFSGGSGSGKSSVLQYMMKERPTTHIAILPMDAYYKDHSHLSLQEKKECNFDDPGAIDFELFIRHIQCLKNSEPVSRPVYSFISCTRQSATVITYPGEVLFIEGLFTLYNQKLRELIDFSVFLDGAEDIRMERIIRRDMNERNRSRQETIDRFRGMVAPMHNLHIEPTRKYADMVVDGSQHDIPYIASVIWDAIDFRKKNKELRTKNQDIKIITKR